MDYFRPDVFLQPPIQQVLKKYSRPPSGPTRCGPADGTVLREYYVSTPPIQQVLKKYSRLNLPYPLRAGGRDYLRRGTRGTSAM